MSSPKACDIYTLKSLRTQQAKAVLQLFYSNNLHSWRMELSGGRIELVLYYWTTLPEDPNSPGQVSCPSSMFPWDPNQCPYHIALVTVY